MFQDMCGFETRFLAAKDVVKYFMTVMDVFIEIKWWCIIKQFHFFSAALQNMQQLGKETHLSLVVLRKTTIRSFGTNILWQLIK